MAIMITVIMLTSVKIIAKYNNTKINVIMFIIHSFISFYHFILILLLLLLLLRTFVLSLSPSSSSYPPLLRIINHCCLSLVRHFVFHKITEHHRHHKSDTIPCRPVTIPQPKSTIKYHFINIIPSSSKNT